jgi:hypothetical protein
MGFFEQSGDFLQKQEASISDKAELNASSRSNFILQKQA